MAVGVGLGVLVGALALFLTEGPPSDWVQQKFLSLRYRAAEYLPHPEQPEFVPTPLAISVAVEPATPTATSTTRAVVPTRTATRPPTLAPEILPIAPAVALRGVKHDYQRWNNCGPTTLEMDLSYFGRTDAQTAIAAFLKPNPDDRNVRPDELAAYVSRTGMRSSTRINGTLDRLRLLLSNGLPVIVETALVKQPQGWMGHYRLVVGYDANGFNTYDSYDGPNVRLSFDELDADWRAFDRLYFIAYPAAQEAKVRAMVGDDADDATMYTRAVTRARAESEANPKDAFAQFNLGTSLNGLRRYAEAAVAFDRARTLGLPWRMLWYQFGPFEAYLQVGRFSEVIALADAMLRTADDLEESHYYKGLALKALGRGTEARQEFEAAVKYNKNYAEAQRELVQ